MMVTNQITKVEKGLRDEPVNGECINSGLDHWTGTLDWNTGLLLRMRTSLVSLFTRKGSSLHAAPCMHLASVVNLVRR